ncbi:MAG: thioredoxin-disulfide reductase [Myxococcota bacterium]|nr:thioredoxin-disulfide reductase [Myxococcota bacterium]
MSTRENPEKVVIFGTGPAGLTAAIYCARADMEPMVYEGLQPGGQLTITTDVDNYPGFPEGIMGPELMQHFKGQAERFGTRFSFEAVESVDLDSWPYHFKAGGEEGWAQTIIVATGASAKYLGLPNETRLQGYGVSACATCDGFFYRDQVVAVVGGGDSAAEEATFLTKFASKVYLLVRRDQMRASKIMQHRVENNDKVEILWNTEVLDVHGEDAVTGIRIINNQTQEERDLDLTGFFLAIGHKPNSDAFGKWLKTDETGYILTQPDSTATDYPGVFACGDVQDHVYRQAITAAGSGCMSALEAERWLEEKLHS